MSESTFDRVAVSVAAARAAAKVPGLAGLRPSLVGAVTETARAVAGTQGLQTAGVDVRAGPLGAEIQLTIAVDQSRSTWAIAHDVQALVAAATASLVGSSPPRITVRVAEILIH